MADKFTDKIIFVKREAEYGTDSGPTGTDAVRVMDLSVSEYEGPVVERTYEKPQRGPYSAINAAPFAQGTFGHEMSGLSAAPTTTVRPAYEELLIASTLVRADVEADTGASPPVPASINYTPDSGIDVDAYGSASVHYFRGNVRQQILGARMSAEFMFNTGELPKINYSMVGRYATPADATKLTLDISDYIAPFPVNNESTTIEIGGSSDLKVAAFTVNMNNNPTHDNLIGADRVLITDSDYAFTLTVEAESVSDFDLYQIVENHKGSIPLQTFKLTHLSPYTHLRAHETPEHLVCRLLL